MKRFLLLFLFIMMVLLVSCEHTCDFGGWNVIQSPTCDTNGLEMRKCECGEIEIQAIEKSGHTKQLVVEKKATCTEDGKEKELCSVCNEVLSENTINSLGHSIVVIEGSKPTCEKNGLSDGEYCSVCSTVIKSQEIIEAAHSFSSDYTIVNPTCNEEGKKITKCLNCNKTVEERIDKIEHNWINATCNNPKTCEECGATEGDVGEHSYNSSGRCTECSASVSATLSLPGTPIKISAISVEATITGISKQLSSYSVSTNKLSYKITIKGKVEDVSSYVGSAAGVPIKWQLLKGSTVVDSGLSYSPSTKEGQTFTMSITVFGLSVGSSYTLVILKN